MCSRPALNDNARNSPGARKNMKPFSGKGVNSPRRETLRVLPFVVHGTYFKSGWDGTPMRGCLVGAGINLLMKSYSLLRGLGLKY